MSAEETEQDKGGSEASSDGKGGGNDVSNEVGTDAQEEAGKDVKKNGKKAGRKDWKKNTPHALKGVFAERLSDDLFEKLSAFVNKELGIKMPDRKKVMLEARLRKRLRALNIATFDAYAEYVFTPEGLEHELVPLLDVVTTNKTDFFREPRHYVQLTENVLPELLLRKARGEPLKIWSAACSSGEEPYTLAIVMSEFAAGVDYCPPFSILGTDVSTQVLYKAIDAVYKEQTIADVDEQMKKKYFMRSKDRGKPLVRVIKDLRKKVSFKRINFMDEDYDVNFDFDIVFCRNVMIYFDRPTQEMVINRICRHIKTDGYLFMGHSETLMGIRAPLQQVVSTVYRKLPVGNRSEPAPPVKLLTRRDTRGK